MIRRTRIQWRQVDENTPAWTEVRTPYDHQLAAFMGMHDGRAQVVYPHAGPGAVDLLDPADVYQEAAS